MQFSLQLDSQSQKNKSVASCGRHITRCTLELQPANLFKTNSMQLLQNVEPSSTLCNCCKPKQVARQVAKRACYMLQPYCNFSCILIETQKPLQVAARDWNLQQIFFSNVVRQFSRKAAMCNTSFKPGLHIVISGLSQSLLNLKCRQKQ